MKLILIAGIEMIDFKQLQILAPRKFSGLQRTGFEPMASELANFAIT